MADDWSPYRTAAGCSWRPGAGRGLTRRPGDSRRFTTGAGHTFESLVLGSGPAACTARVRTRAGGLVGIAVAVRVGGGGGVGVVSARSARGLRSAYRVSPRYVTRVNVTNTVVNNVYVTNVYEKRVTNITYRNRVVPGAVMAVPRAVFASAGRTRDRTACATTIGTSRATRPMDVRRRFSRCARAASAARRAAMCAGRRKPS